MALPTAGAPFVRATVVRALHPTSAHAGDVALVHPDGQLEGFVGGVCAEEAVRTHALDVLVSGEPLLLRVVAGAAVTVREEGAVTVANPCLSGGGVEVFLEPHRPAPRVAVVGGTPVARALAELAAPLGLRVETSDPALEDDGAARDGDDGAGHGGAGHGFEGVTAVVVASHGRGEQAALRAALAARVPYVGLVASRRRGAAVLAGVSAAGVEGADAVHSPAGLDIGARTAPQVALSILAEVLASGVLAAPGAAAAPAPSAAPVAVTAVDPVCGMAVVVRPGALSAEVGGRLHHYCSEHCRSAHRAAPAAGADDPGRHATG